MNKKIISLYKEISRSINTVPLSQSMPLALRLARELGDTEFEKWLRLEIGGYFKDNPAITADVKVPDYRTVVGFHLDRYGRPLQTDSSTQFINNLLLRNGIEELEKWASTNQTITIQNPLSIEMIKEYFQVDVYAFSFSTLPITGILSLIKIKLTDWLYDIQHLHPELENVMESETAALPRSNNSPIQINIGEGTSMGNLVVARSITNSFNKIESATVSDDLKELLRNLTDAVQAMVVNLSNENAEQVARDLETLTAEATSKSPRKKWWQLSADGLKKAARNVGEIGLPVLNLVAMVIKQLSMKP